MGEIAEQFLLVTGGEWHAATVPGNETTVLSFEAVQSMVAAGSVTSDASNVRTAAGVDVVEPADARLAWAVVGRVVAGGLEIGDANGGLWFFGVDELAAIEDLRRGQPLANVELLASLLSVQVATTGSAPATTVAEDVDTVEVTAPTEPEVAAQAAPAAAPPALSMGAKVRQAYQLSSKLAWLRKLLGDDGSRDPSISSNGQAPTADTGDGREADDHELIESEPAAEVEPEATLQPFSTAEPVVGGGRVPVYSIWHAHTGPLLSLGMLVSSAREWNDGALNDSYELRLLETAESFLEDLATRSGPAVLVCSDYVWSIDHNLRAAHAALKINPDILFLHGGPSSPKYEADISQFYVDHGDVTHVLARGEGEHTFCELLEAFAESPTPAAVTTERIGHIGGISFIDADSGEFVKTPDRERIRDLTTLPSPYITGEFDHIPAEAWKHLLAIETNRGCPYGCTFCDWGSATMSRIRKFDLARVYRELDWAADHGVLTLMIADANFGIMSRDVDIAEKLSDLRHNTGHPLDVVATPAKNTTKHIARITDTLVDAGITPFMALSLQTIDQTTLDAIERSNISVDHYVRLAAEYRRRGLPLQGDVLLGLPTQTYQTYRTDLQFNMDHEILVRTWPVQVLPNAPMNEPGYREKFALEIDSSNLVRSTVTFDAAQRERMLRLRRLHLICEAFAIARHLLRWVQWDHNIEATIVMDHILDVVEETPERFPRLTFLVSYFDLFPVVPVRWVDFYEELATLLVEDYSIERTSALETMLDLQVALMPFPGRTFPHSVDLAHDYLRYYRDATASLYETGHAGTPPRPLEEYPPAVFTVTGDPIGLCTDGLEFKGDSRDELMQGDFNACNGSAYDLDSQLIRLLPHVVRYLSTDEVARIVADVTDGMTLPPLDEHGASSRVSITAKSS